MIATLMAALLAAQPAPAALPTPALPTPALPTPARRQELLFEAAKLGRTDMIEPLVKSGADIDAYNDRGFTPLILAAYDGHPDTVDALLARGADPCKPDRDQGNTAQMGVAFKGDDAIAARLLKTKCDVNARNHAGQTALMMAALFNRTKQVDMLVAAGADRSILDVTGRSAGSVAAGQGNAAMVDHLRR